MAPFYEEICQGVRVREAFECAPALVGVNVVRPVGRSTLTPPARRRAMAPVPGPAGFLCQVELQGVEGVLGAGLAIDPPDYEQLGRFAFTETGGVVGPRLPVLSAGSEGNRSRYLVSHSSTAASVWRLGLISPRTRSRDARWHAPRRWWPRHRV